MLMIDTFVANLFSYNGLLDLVKVATLVLEIFYLGFAFIVVRQIGLMNRSLKTKYGFYFKLVAYLHFFAVAGLVVLTVLLL